MLKTIGFLVGVAICISSANMFVHMAPPIDVIETGEAFVLAIVGVAFLSLSLR